MPVLPSDTTPLSVPLTVIVKISSTCNFACTYCDADIYSRQRMSFEVLAQTIATALKTGRPTHFIWHGGEPLMLGREFFKKAVWLQQKFRKPGQSVTNSLQTNGSLLDDEWLDLFEICEISVGVSLDGPPELHNSQRVLQNRKGTFPQVMRAISLLKARGRRFGILAVVTDETVKLGAQRFFDFFIENGIFSFAILCRHPAIITGANDYMLREDHSRFVREIFDIWYRRDNPEIHIRDFESIMRAMLGGKHSICLLAGSCVGKYFAVNFNGDIYHCDEFMTDQRYRLGNVSVDDFATISSGPAINLLMRTERSNLEQLNCKWQSICNGGCPKDRYVAALYAGGAPIRCCGYADLIEHIQSRIAENPRLAQLKLVQQQKAHRYTAGISGRLEGRQKEWTRHANVL
jgi:uncharacterized protein